MHRDLIAHPHIASFSAFLLFAFFAAYFLGRWNAVRVNIPGRHIDNQALLLVVCGLFGARFFSWLFYFPPGTNFWKAMTAVEGGLVFYGGVIFSVLAVIGYGVWSRISLARVAEVWAAPIALGLGIGRVGCFMAGCCWGDVCMPTEHASLIADSVTRRQILSIPLLSSSGFPLALRFPAGTGAYDQHRELGLISENAASSLPVHPAQLYEACLVLVLAIAVQRKFLRESQIAFRSFALGYGVIRFLVEFVRADNPPIYVGLTLSQVISLGFVAFALCSSTLARSEKKSAQTCACADLQEETD
jgi:phosphatidylglycerol:prolipoprotein diacylglycerol transferase